MASLVEKHCIPCEKGARPLNGGEIDRRLEELDPGWHVVDGHHLERQFSFDDFRRPLDFVIRVGEVAEEEGHHPDICFGYGQAKIDLWTHKINGLHENDFILAAKIDQLV